MSGKILFYLKKTIAFFILFAAAVLTEISLSADEKDVQLSGNGNQDIATATDSALTDCTEHTFEYSASGNKITACCTKCGHTEYVELIIPGMTDHAATSAELCLCENPVISYEKSEGWDSSFPYVRVVYTNPQKKLTYNTMPKDAESFHTVHLEVYSGKRSKTVLASTNPVELTVSYHRWEYSADDITMNADCTSCKAHASVELNPEGAYAANLTAEENTYSGVDYEMFIDYGWREQKGIAEYYVLYDGIQAKEDYKQGIKYQAFTRPDGPGDYKAYLVLVSDPLDPSTAYLKTNPVAYYIATVPLSECEVKDYTVAQLKSFTLPSKGENGFYQVGTKEELLALVYLQEDEADIELTADIVMNPITVDEDGNVLSGTYSIYNWIPIDSKIVESGNSISYLKYASGYEGTIRGNGHTIYGLYNESNLKVCGLVSRGDGCIIENLTMENCVFDAASYAGAFMGYTDYYVTKNGKNYTFRSLKAIHCRISADECAGGLIGFAETSGGCRPDFLFDSCISDSFVQSSGTAGGLIGAFESPMKMIFQYCMNLGNIQGNTAAGGILGSAEDWNEMKFSDSANAGNLSSSGSTGGMLGYMGGESKPFINSNKYPCIADFNHCISIGKMHLARNTGGIIGKIESSGISDTTVTMTDCSFSQTRNAVASSDYSGDLSGTKLSNTLSASYLCETFYAGTHMSTGHWEITQKSGCEQEGKQVQRCLICGNVLEEKILPGHSHQIENGICNFCGESGKSATASVFAENSWAILVMFAVIIIGVAVVMITNRKKVLRLKNKK